MHRNNTIFQLLTYFFWICLGILVLYFLFVRNLKEFNPERFSTWYEQFDTTAVSIDSSFLWKDSLLLTDSLLRHEDTNYAKPQHFHWKWKNYEGELCEIQFSIPSNELQKAKTFRENYSFFGKKSLYLSFIEACKVPLNKLNNAMVAEMNKRGLRGIDRLNFVVTAIQTPPYTMVDRQGMCPSNSRCNPGGCCGNVQPFAIFTPTEFIFQRTGDCDTKSLVCYAILKMQGVDAALLTGLASSSVGSQNPRNMGHAMLGIASYAPSIPSKNLTYFGKIYYPWETTDFHSEFQLGNMRMWSVWRDWEVTIN